MVIRCRTGIVKRIADILALFPIWFYLFLFVFIINRYLIRPSEIQFIDGYLNDLLCLPILLQLVQVCMKLIVNKNYVLSLFQTIVAIIYCSVLFEIILPKYSNHYISDIYDTICYLSGGIIWKFLLNTYSIKHHDPSGNDL
jgi:hypothetical protein